MFSGLTGLADKLSSLIREPVTPLGNAVHDCIYASGYGTSQFQKITDMVLSTSDPDALDEVWFVLSKALGSSNNSDIRQSLKLADYLIKHTGARFHNTCNPLFMRKMKEMILYKAKTGGADNMHLMNDARAMVRVWGEGFLPYASQGRGKVIVEGYQDMQRSGIRFPAAPNEEENKWVPMVTVPTSRSNASSSSSSSYYGGSGSSSSNSSSVPSKAVSEVNPKELYRNVKKLLAKLDEEGLDFFANERAQSIVEDSKASQKALMVMIDRETTRGSDENLLSHLLTLNDMCQQLSKMYAKYEKKLAEAKKKKNDGWSDDDAQADDWDDSPKPAPRRARKPVEDAEPEVQVRSTRRRAARDAAEETTEKSKPTQASQSASEDLLGLGLWDETPAQPAQPAQPAKSSKPASRKPASDDWGFDEDVAPAPATSRRAKKVTIDDLFEEEEEAPKPAASRRAKKPSMDDLFDDEDEPKPAASRRAKKPSTVDDLFDDEDEPKPAPRRARKPTTDDWDDEPQPAPRRAKKPATVDDLFDEEDQPKPAPRRARKPAADDWDDEPQAAPRRAKKPAQKPAEDDWGFDDEPAPATRRAPRQAAAPAPVETAPVDPFASMDFDFTKQNLSPSAPSSASAPAAKKDAFDDLFSL